MTGPTAAPLPRDDGYRGIWYSMQRLGERYKYSGGLGTYPQQITPMACYSAEADKTFFCYGGTVKGRQELLNMVSFYDHATGTVPRPVILLNKHTDDAHDNPSMMLDDRGHVWVFSNAHGTERPSYIYRSVEPFAIDRFERVLETNFSYAQPWFLPQKGFLLLHTRYVERRRLLHWQTSPDGFTWSPPRLLARVEKGHYQTSWRRGDKVATMFNVHPLEGGLDVRTNLYYLETTDFGATWRTAAGEPIETPLGQFASPALVHDYRAEGLRVYLKNVQIDADGRPVLLYLTSRGHEPGPQNDPRTWWTARWTGSAWEILPVTTSDHNYDYGCLTVEPDGTWRLIAPTEPGPQPYDTGGEVVLWTSADRGKHWRKVRHVTRRSRFNHTYLRVPFNAHPDFYAFWADGDTCEPSDSTLYFTDRTCGRVWRLPRVMRGDRARPEVVEFP